MKHTSYAGTAYQSKATCRIDGCRKRHHMLLHETRKVIASQSIAEKEIAQNNSIQSTAIQSKTYLQVLPVILSNDSYSKRTNALLDCGADSTLSEKTFLKSYNLKENRSR